MGHISTMDVYDYTESKDYILYECNEYATRDGTHRDPIDKIRFIDRKTYPNLEEAEQAISDQDDGWYDCLAVPFYEYPNFEVQYTKEYLAIYNRYQELRKKQQYLQKRLHYTPETVTSKTIGCKKCGMRIPVAQLRRNYCPNCSADLRPQSVLDKIDKLGKQISELEAKGSKIADKCKKDTARRMGIKQNKKWLVKYEFPC